MAYTLDHVFILVAPGAAVADALLAFAQQNGLGIEESFRRDHPGQGTSNRRFLFANTMLEFLWLRDEAEANNGTAKNLAFPARSTHKTASPFGIILRDANSHNAEEPFFGWVYQPAYFKPPMAFLVANNSHLLNEPLCIYAPFLDAKPFDGATVENINLASVTRVEVKIAANKLSGALVALDRVEGLAAAASDEALMAITLANHQPGRIKDFRPQLPLVLHW